MSVYGQGLPQVTGGISNALNSEITLANIININLFQLRQQALATRGTVNAIVINQNIVALNTGLRQTNFRIAQLYNQSGRISNQIF
jgi:hypothetical protein